MRPTGNEEINGGWPRSQMINMHYMLDQIDRLMTFLFRIAKLLAVLSLIKGVCQAEMLGTFEARVLSASAHSVVPLPVPVAKGDLVIGCFRYDPTDAQLAAGPDIYRSWRYRFYEAPPRNVFAISVGSLVWRSGGTFVVIVRNDRSGPGDPGRPFDEFFFAYDTRWHQMTVLPEHPGLLLGGRAGAGFGFRDKSLPLTFLRSTELPNSLPDFHFAGVDEAKGHIFGWHRSRGKLPWAVHFDLDMSSLVINGRPALPGAVPPETAEEAAGLCSEAVVSDASEDTETR